jgi:hypothetical protein
MIKKIVLTYVLAIVTLFANGAPVSLKDKESIGLTQGNIKVSLKLDRARANGDCPSAASWWWGIERACPSTRIASLEVQFKGAVIFIPYSVFSDLGNPTSIDIEQDKKGEAYLLKIKGGDAADSYTAIIKFRSQVLLERAVRSGEFPADAWEKTTYKFNF